MDDVRQGKRQGAVGGFTAVWAVLAFVVWSPWEMADLVGADGGWVFLAVAGVAVAGGVGLLAARPAPVWRSVGKGMIAAGVVGALAAVTLVLVFLLTWGGPSA